MSVHILSPHTDDRHGLMVRAIIVISIFLLLIVSPALGVETDASGILEGPEQLMNAPDCGILPEPGMIAFFCIGTAILIAYRHPRPHHH